MEDIGIYIFMVCIGFVGSAVNAIAGGGSFIAFPAMLEVGLPSVVANMSSKVAFTPGSLAAAITTAKYAKSYRYKLFTMCFIGVCGSFAGAMLLKYTGNEQFNRLVPFLLFFATLLLWISPYINKKIRQYQLSEDNRIIRVIRNIIQSFTAVYGGFFGAGLGIMLLSSLGLSGMDNMKAMNALKNITAFFIHTTALCVFVLSGFISWPHCLAQMAGAIVGGVWGGLLVSKLPDHVIRYFVLTLGIFLSLRYAIMYY